MPDQQLSLRHPRGSSRIIVGSGALERASADLGDWCRGRRTFLVTSEPVYELYADRLADALASAGGHETLLVPDGEAAKTPEIAARLWREMLEAGGKRDSRLITLGGGSVGDLGGFVAGTFLRGIEFCQVPTTLLAQVDASVGGKTAVDLDGGKNTVGVFHHPAIVVADTDLLATLAIAERRSGLVEVIKMAALLDVDLFVELEDSLDRLLSGDGVALAPIVAAAIAAKIRVVEEDPEEGGNRRLLNFGHTLGHAIEAEVGYGGMRHGEAVGWGILFAIQLGYRRGFPQASGGRIDTLLRRLSLPALPELGVDALMSSMGRDKKALESGLTWVLAADLGEGRLVDDLGFDEVRSVLTRFLASAG